MTYPEVMLSPFRLCCVRAAAVVLSAVGVSCAQTPVQTPPPSAGSGDAAFSALAAQILDDHYKRHPSVATDLGLHEYDAQLEDSSEAAVHAESEALQRFRDKLSAIDPGHADARKPARSRAASAAVGAGVLALDRIRQWAKDPDGYSSAITNAAYVIMKRNYAPAAERLKSLIERERKMPAALHEARKNLDRPRRASTPRSRSSRSTATSASSRTICRRRSRRSPTSRCSTHFSESNKAVIAALGRLQDVPARRSCCRSRPAASRTAPTRIARRSRPTR